MYSTDEGMALRDGQSLNIQCLLIEVAAYRKKEKRAYYHYHKYNELIYMLSGELEAYIGDNTYLCRAGELSIIYSGEPHTFFCRKDCRYIVIKFLPEILSTYEQTLNEFEYVYNMSDIVSNRSRIISDIPEMDYLMRDAFDSFSKNEYADELLVRSDIIRICARMIKFWYERGEISPLIGKISGENLKIVRKVMYDTVSSRGNVKTSEAARWSGFSEGYFSRLFKKISGMTFTEYTKSVKMNEAVRLLQCTDDSITAISQKLGYATTSHFIEDFRKTKGVTPKKMRKRES